MKPMTGLKYKCIQWDPESKKFKCSKCIDFHNRGDFNVFLYYHFFFHREQEYKKSNFDRHIQKWHKEATKTLDSYSKNSLRVNSKDEQRLVKWLKFIVLGGRPFEIINDKNLRELTREGDEMDGLVISVEKLKAHMDSRFIDMKHALKEKLKNAKISLKFDCASRYNRQFLCITAQIYENFEIHNYCLDFVELYDRHTADHLSNIILSVLNEYCLEKIQILGCTTDTASNMLATVRSLNEKFDKNDKIELDYIEENLIEENLVGCVKIHEIRHIKCSSHVINLVIGDFLKDKIDVLNKSRSIVKYLRRPNNISLIRKMQMNIPPLDCPTRYYLKYCIALICQMSFPDGLRLLIS